MRVEFRRLDAGASIPGYAHVGDAGLDLAANADVVLKPGERALVPTGLAVAIPLGHAGLVLPRSSLASRHGITLVNAPGLIDSGYRGEITIAVVNLDRRRRYKITRSERIAQLLVVPFTSLEPTEVVDLTDTSRGTGGFGSTGT